MGESDVAERVARGQGARAGAPRSSHAAGERRPAEDVLLEQAAERGA